MVLLKRATIAKVKLLKELANISKLTIQFK